MYSFIPSFPTKGQPDTREALAFCLCPLCQVVARNLEHAAEVLKPLGLQDSQLPFQKKWADPGV